MILRKNSKSSARRREKVSRLYSFPYDYDEVRELFLF